MAADNSKCTFQSHRHLCRVDRKTLVDTYPTGVYILEKDPNYSRTAPPTNEVELIDFLKRLLEDSDEDLDAVWKRCVDTDTFTKE